MQSPSLSAPAIPTAQQQSASAPTSSGSISSPIERIGNGRVAQAGRGRLVLQNISKNFAGSTVHALQDISVTCEPGEFVVVVGPSGCGKSTLLNVAAGMIQPDSGTIALDERPADGPGPDRAMVFQEHGLFPWL